MPIHSRNQSCFVCNTARYRATLREMKYQLLV